MDDLVVLMCMTIPISIKVSETETALRLALSKAKPYQRARLKMLLLLATGTSAVGELARKTKSGTASIRIWKLAYHAGGLEALLSDKRGGDKRSGISAEDKASICKKLSDPNGGLRSYKEARVWLKEELNIDKKYHALNKYLKRNFGTKLKVGRKSHVKKDQTATADYKKPSPGAGTH